MTSVQRGNIFKGCFPLDRLRLWTVVYATHPVIFSETYRCNLLEMPRAGRGEGGGEGERGREGGGSLRMKLTR